MTNIYYVYSTVEQYGDLRQSRMLFTDNEVNFLRAQWARRPHLIAEDLQTMDNRDHWLASYDAMKAKQNSGELNAEVLLV